MQLQLPMLDCSFCVGASSFAVLISHLQRVKINQEDAKRHILFTHFIFIMRFLIQFQNCGLFAFLRSFFINEREIFFTVKVTKCI